MEKIKYIGFYDIELFDNEKRVRSIAAVNKMNYIAGALVDSGYIVEIVSPSWSSTKTGYFRSRTCKVFENVVLKVGPTFGAENLILKRFRIFLSWLWLFSYLLINAKKKEKVIVYHSIMAIYPIYLAKKIKKFEVILELNEIYQDVSELSHHYKNIENKIIQVSSAYIISTEMLKSKIDDNKPFLINYGNYRPEGNRYSPYNDKIHIVYAGIIDLHKAGAFNAIESARHLSKDYIIHIIGFGNLKNINELKEKIAISNQIHECKVIFDGIKNGDEYVDYVSKCHIGLSTQA
ncbi:hypothetical protein, partial [uncultured Planktosalinus sp.]|uniref:hypothetical protein n=1 Tax=uncultured Planktosalinus sp. TaxID=1810935 RepID=UPI0030D733BE